MSNNKFPQPLLLLNNTTSSQEKNEQTERVFSAQKNVENIEKDETTEVNISRFKGMTKRQQIDYLLNLSSYIPQLTCIIETDQDDYRCSISEATDKYVIVELLSRKRLKLHISEITAIKLLSFK